VILALFWVGFALFLLRAENQALSVSIARLVFCMLIYCIFSPIASNRLEPLQVNQATACDITLDLCFACYEEGDISVDYIDTAGAGIEYELYNMRSLGIRKVLWHRAPRLAKEL
jgi:hypothetical protein